MRFENRETTNPNRKTLSVLDVSYNSQTGELSSLTVDEVSNEGTVIEQGTKLNAENLNNVFEDLNRNKFLYLYYKEAIGITIAEEMYTIELSGATVKSIPIAYDYTLYPVIKTNTYLNLSFNSTSTTLSVQMKANYQSSARSGALYVEYYKESSHTHLVCILNIKYTYTPASTNPSD